MASEKRIANKAEYEALFRAHFEDLCKVAYPILKDADRTQDAVQEVFLDLWRKRDQLRVKGSFKAYLYKAVVYKSLDFLRKQKRMAGSLPEQSDHLVPSGAYTEDQVRDKELADALAAGIEKLPPKCRMVFSLSRYQGLKNREIAEHMDISIKTVENQLGKALKMLREHLAPYLQNAPAWIWVWLGLEI